MKPIIDLRSDTVTKPTEEMRKAMYEAEVGDDVIGEDKTVIELERLGADMLGKEASLFVPSGTFGNQLGLFTLCERRDEVILSELSHIVQHEAGAASVLSSVQMRTIMPEHGYLVWEEIEPRIRNGVDIHFPKTGAIALENALSSGDIQPLSIMRDIRRKAANIPVHLDGARIFNAALAMGVDASVIAEQADTVMFCLSKGLCAPIGSLLAGSSELIEKARFLRKVMGGGMRQAGVIAAPGIISLKKMTKRLHEDHENARIIGEALSRYKIFSVDLAKIKINMVFVSFQGGGIPEKEKRFYEICKEKGIITYPPKYGGIRLVTHNDVTDEALKYFLEQIPEIAEALSVL